MATYDLTSIIPSSIETGDILNCPYSGNYIQLTLAPGKYKLEAWGAQGGAANTVEGGKGGYSTGYLELEDPTLIYLSVGGKGDTISVNNSNATGNLSNWSSGTSAKGSISFGGGGYPYAKIVRASTYTTYASSGGGASDIRIGTNSLYSRVMVAGGGGGSGSLGYWNEKGFGGSGGGSSGTEGSTGSGAGHIANPGSESSGGSGDYAYNSTNTFSSNGMNVSGTFGYGGSFSIQWHSGGGDAAAGGGGGGWYGGASGVHNAGGGGGGSGYIYTSTTAASYPSGCLLDSKYYLSDASMIAGNNSMIDPESGSSVTGRSGNGYIRITAIEVKTIEGYANIEGTWCEIDTVYMNIESAWKNIDSILSNIENVWK